MDDSKKNFCNFHDSYLRQYIQQADTKAAWLFAASSAITIWILSKSQYMGSKLSGNLCEVNIFYIISLILITLSSVFAFNVIRPRLINGKHKGVIYFSSVAKFQSPDDYFDEVIKLTDSDIFKARLQAQYDMSKICHSKYTNLVWGAYLAFAGIAIISAVHIRYTLF